MSSYKEFPEVGEYVIVTITGINPNSAFAKLDEYEQKSGMIHISEVASTWIRDIRKYISVGNKKVAKVLSVDTSRGYINLSLKRVKPTTERDKKSEWKNEKKAENLLSIVSKELNLGLSDTHKKVGAELQKNHGLLYVAFEVAATEGAQTLIKEGIDEVWANKIEEIAKRNIKPKVVTIKTILDVRSYKPNGIEIIKEAFRQVDNDAVEIVYINAPKYSITVTSGDYLECERLLSESSQKVINHMSKSGGEALLLRKK